MENWVALGEYRDKEVLVQTEAVLKANEIEFRLISPENHLNAAFGQGTDQPFIIEVASDQIELAKTLVLAEDEDEAVLEVSMAEYTLEELKEIVLNPEDWHQGYITKAKEELSRRGSAISEAEVENTREEKIRQLEEGTVPSKTIYYFMWACAFFGGYFGIIAGYYYWRGKVKGLDGKRYYMYADKYRKQGYIMFILAIFSALVQTYLVITYA